LRADDRHPQCDDRGEEDPDDRVGGKLRSSLDKGDRPGHEQAEGNHREEGVHAEKHADRHTGEGGMSDGVGEERHPEVDEGHADGRRCGGDEEHGQDRPLHEERLRETERQEEADHGEQGV
jgi:hypothetical protein